MSLRRFLDDLLHDGKVAFRAPPAPEPVAAEVRQLLEEAYATYRLQVAGDLLPFVAEPALAAAEVVRQSCWFLLSHDEEVVELNRRLRLPPPRGPADHLSADMLLRYLPQVHQRARTRAADDPLRHRLVEILRHWPLSGVLADLVDPPLTPPEFGHSGLQMLYAERLAKYPKPGWLPAGAGLQQVELACHELGRDTRALQTVTVKGE